MKIKYFRSIIFVLAMLLMSTLFASTVNSKIVTSDIKTQIYGEYDFNSNEITSVIVELQEESLVEAKHKGENQTKENLKFIRNSIIDEVEFKVNAKVNREYDYVFSGFSLELSESNILSLSTIKGIKAIYPNVKYTTTEINNGQFLNVDTIKPDMMYSAPFIGANEAWDLGYTGDGITVAIIDTGSDYTHPDLIHAFGNYKGYDFVDNDFDPQEYPGEYHGTHVSGIVAGNGLIKGIAPEASLIAYRVLGPDGGYTEDVVAAIELAVEDDVDVMNLSLGNDLNSPDWATSIALDWAMEEGVVAVTSNGNTGPENWTVGSPGTSREAISVGATKLPYNTYNASLYTSDDVSYPTSKVMGFYDESELLALNGNTYEYVDVGLGYPEDFEGKDLVGKIALISRGDLAFWDKAINTYFSGAVGAIIYNNVEGEIPYVIDGMYVPTIKLDNIDGQKMLDELNNGNNTVTISIDFAGVIDESIADFSSRGPVATTWMIKPDVSAPGVNIISTAPGGLYMAADGTSMASPHVAGAVALILQAHPNWDVDDVKAAIMNTAQSLINPFTGEEYPHNTQGAGSIRIVDAINTKTLVTPGSHSFGIFDKDNGMQVEKQKFEIKNLSNDKKRYSFNVEFEGNPEGIKINTSNNLLVNANETQLVQFNVQVDASLLEPGYYEGTIIVSDGIEEIKVPTILFIGEPDYPRIVFGGIEMDGEDFIIWDFLTNGADYYSVWIYSNEPFGYVGDALELTDLTAGYHEYIWDGSINGEPLQPGSYHAFIYVEKAGVGDYIYAGPFVIEE